MKEQVTPKRISKQDFRIPKDDGIRTIVPTQFFYGIVVTGLKREYLLGIGYNHGTIFMPVQLIIKRRVLKPGIEIPSGKFFYIFVPHKLFCDSGMPITGNQ